MKAYLNAARQKKKMPAIIIAIDLSGCTAWMRYNDTEFVQGTQCFHSLTLVDDHSFFFIKIFKIDNTK